MKKTLAIVLVCAMILSLFGVAVFAVKAEMSEEVGETSSDEPSEVVSDDPSEEPSEEAPAETDLWIALDRTVGAAGRDVRVDFTIRQNPGFWGFSLFVDYDPSVLTLKSVALEPGVKQSGEIGLLAVDPEDNPFVFRCFARSLSEDYTMTGVLATAVFTVAEDAPVGTRTDIGIQFRSNDIINLAADEVPTTVWNGSVRIVPADELPEEPSEEPSAEPSEEPSAEPSEEPSDVSEEIVIGDASGDGGVDMKDVLLVRKSIAGMGTAVNETAADVNRDGGVDMKDVLLMRKFIAGLIDRLT